MLHLYNQYVVYVVFNNLHLLLKLPASKVTSFKENLLPALGLVCLLNTVQWQLLSRCTQMILGAKQYRDEVNSDYIGAVRHRLHTHTHWLLDHWRNTCLSWIHGSRPT